MTQNDEPERSKRFLVDKKLVSTSLATHLLSTIQWQVSPFSPSRTPCALETDLLA
jgi:hypothetical protein